MKSYKAFSVSLQVLACILFMSFPLLFISNQGGTDPWLLIRNYDYWLFCVSFILLYYLNAYVFIPEFLVKKRYVIYAVLLIVLAITFHLLKPFDRLMRTDRQERGFRPTAHIGSPPPHGYGTLPKPPEHGTSVRLDITTIYIFVMVIALSTASRMIGFWVNTEQRMHEVERDKAKAELAFLKTQVHPHFLFNTLNNIYTLAVTHHEKTAESIHQLARLMRYFMEEPQQTLVPLQQEINCLKDYIALQKLRLGKLTSLHLSLADVNRNIEIAPLLLITFVENVFKYGISKQSDSPLYIQLNSDENRIEFHTRNKIHALTAQNVSSGIGIANVQKRLEQLYPNRHTLTIKQDNQWFDVFLVINL